MYSGNDSKKEENMYKPPLHNMKHKNYSDGVLIIVRAHQIHMVKLITFKNSGVVQTGQ